MMLAWLGAGRWINLATAFGAMVMVVWLIDRHRKGRGTTRAEIAAVALTGLWSLIGSAAGPSGLLAPHSSLATLGEVARNLGWLVVVLTLFARDHRDETVRPVRPVLAVLALIELLQVMLVVLAARFGTTPTAFSMIGQLSDLLHLLMTTGALVLVHNLYIGAVARRRGAVRWNCLALAVLWGFDLNFYTIAYLAHAVPDGLVALRALAQAAALAMIGIAARRGGSSRLSPSRTVAFQLLALVVIGLYLVVMVGAARSVARLGGDPTELVQLGFAFVTTVIIIALVPSARLGRWLNVVLAKHLFQHRYDYRAEWLRFARTIGRADTDSLPLQARVVQAVADITDSARGLLLIPGDGGALVLAARWRWPTIDVPGSAMDPRAVAFLERTGFVVDLDQVRKGTDHAGEGALMPAWMVGEEAIWVLVPLLHFERLVGLVVLGRPAIARDLDWEDFDLLRVVGQQLASFLAEQTSQAALLEASRFDEFNRRIAFVMHDIKNLASQLALLARNAERHADNPAFRGDMLVTLRNAADKLNALIARLSRYGAGTISVSEPVEAGMVVRAVAARCNRAIGREQVICGDVQPCRVLASPETLDQVLGHLVQNALDASDSRLGVTINTRTEHAREGAGQFGVIEVIDSGCGMSADFVRSRLFTPFVSTKPGGFGIGAFEARELIIAMRGTLDVESREGLGSRFTIRLPVAPAVDISQSSPISLTKAAAA